MNDLSKSLKILVDRYPGTMAELARQAQIDRSSLYKIMDGKRMPNRAQLQRLIHALGLNARQAEHLTTQYDELRSGAQAHRTDEALYELLQTAMRSRDNLMNDVLAPMPRSEADLEAAFTSRCYQGYQAVTQQLHLLLTRYLRSEEKRPLMLSPFVGERALSSILIGAFSAEASPKPVWHLLRFVTNNDAQENFIGNVRTVSRALPFLVLRSMQYEARLSCAPSAGPLPPEARRELLLRMRTACENNTAVLRIVSAEAFPLDPHITVTAFRGRSVAFCTLSDDPQEGFCREYTLRDAMLANRLADYMSNLKDSSLVCTQRYTLEYIDFCLRLL